MNTTVHLPLLLVFIALLLLSSSVVFAQEAAVPEDSLNKTGCFSSMRYYDDTGDVGGLELFIVYSNDGYHVLFQMAEGGPTPPQLVRATVKGDQLSFVLPNTVEGGTADTFTGNFTRTGLTGKFKSGMSDPVTGRSVITLKRTKSYWQH